MALRAETLNVDPEVAEPAVAVPVEVAEPPEQDTAEEFKQAAVAAFENVKTYATESYWAMADRSKRLAAGIRRKFYTTREEKPLLIVAVAAGLGIAMGVALRVWRSKYYE